MTTAPEPDPKDTDDTEPTVDWETFEAAGRALVNPPKPPSD